MRHNPLTVCQKILLEAGWNLNILNRRIATITNPKGERKTTYFGFDTKQQAEAFQQFMLQRNLCTDGCVRQAERLATEWECKTWGVSTELIVFLLNCQHDPSNH